MGLLDKLWDDVLAGPTPQTGLGRLRKSRTIGTTHLEPVSPSEMTRRNSGDFSAEELERVNRAINVKPPLLRTTSSLSQDSSGSSQPTSPSASSPGSREKVDVWRSVFHPGGPKSMDSVGSGRFDKPQPNSPTVYDWLYSGDTKSKWR